MGETFGRLVKRLRGQVGLTQKQLATRSKLSEPLISRYERGKVATQFRNGTLEALAHGLGLSKDNPDRRLLFQVAWEHEHRQRATKSALRFATLLEPITKISFTAANAAGLEKDYSQPQVLERMEDVADCTTWMLGEASKLKLDKVGAEEILDTTQGSSSLFRYLDRDDRWSYAIRLAMESKWNVVSLYRMTGDLERAFEVIREIRNLSVYPEQYIPRYFRRIGELRPPYNLLIVPHIGALLALSTHNPAVVDAAFFYPDNPNFAPYIKSLTDHFNLLFTETTQLARTYKPRSPEWEDTMTATCQREADEFLANNQLDPTTMPPVLYDELLQESLRSENTYSAMVFRTLKTHHTQRREAFEHHVQSFKYLTIMPQGPFEDAVREGRYAMVHPHYPHKYVTVEKRQVIEHIEYFIRDLRRYDNYEIALFADDDDRYAKDLLRTPWLVKGEASVLTATYTESEDGQLLMEASELEITEPSVVRSFRQQFLDIWRTIADSDKAKQKENVIGWLTRLLEGAKGTREGS